MEHRCTPPVPAKDPAARDRSVRKSLAARGDFVLLGLSLVVGIGAALLACFPALVHQPARVHLGEWNERLALPIAVFPLAWSLLFISAVLTPLRAAAELRWLAALPFPFAHQGYFTVLKKDPAANGLQLLLTFEHAPKQADVETLCKSRVRGSKLVWQDDRCILVESPKRAAPSAYARGVYANAPLHRWFRRVAAPFLCDLHRRAGLKKVELRT